MLPEYGALACVASRRFAEACIPLLEAGGIADHVDRAAARGLRAGSFASNAVVHDNAAVSTISEERRKGCLGRGAGDEPGDQVSATVRRPRLTRGLRT